MDKLEYLNRYAKTSKFRNALKIPLEYDLEFKLLAQGEYNVNYLFIHPYSGQKLLLRVNTGSQMHLDNQIDYEYNALKELFSSGRTPQVYYVDGTKKDFPFGVLVMEFLEGKPLNYLTDLKIAAECLSDIHSTKVSSDTTLISPKNLLYAMVDECENMAKVYLDSPLGDTRTKNQIKRLINYCKEKIKFEKDYNGDRHYINTELNSGNFLINGPQKNNYIIDWEKPLLGEPAQDLAHFLAPTTTFWKTDVILEKTKMYKFINDYIDLVKDRFDTSNIIDRFETYMPLTCLRGITWCSMAWIQYNQSEKILQNEFTYKKIESYLKHSFLDEIESNYFL